MGKRRRFEQDGGDMCSSDNSSVDRLSMLPDELLSFILSHISLKEQAATSILSRRWRYLWTLTTRLDFDGVESLLSIDALARKWSAYDQLLALEKAKFDFVSRVNHVLASRKGSAIEEFKVYFDLDITQERFINEWLRYALAWKVERLELNLNSTHMKPDKHVYVFRVQDRFFSHIDDEEVGFKYLKTMSLSHVGVDGKALEFLLHNCPLLEDLSVSFTLKLLSLSVTGPFPSLKRLEISNCSKLELLEIRDVTNLVCFKYSGRQINFLLQNLPRLAHVSVSKSIFKYMKASVAQFSSILKQLEIFNIDLELSMRSFLLPLGMSNLKRLEVVVSSLNLARDRSLLWLADLIHSAPRLQKFVLESGRTAAAFPERELQRMKVEKSYPHLEEVEFVGFCGVPSDLEFVFHFVDNAPALKKIVINTKKIGHDRRDYINYNHISKDVRNLLKNQIALEKPWMKLDFISAPI